MKGCFGLAKDVEFRGEEKFKGVEPAILIIYIYRPLEE